MVIINVLFVIFGFHQAELPDGFSWVHMHQTWLDGSRARDQTVWCF